MQQAQSEAKILKAQRVLIADEQPHSRRFILDLCRSLGLVEMATAQSSEQAVSALEQAPFDILLCVWGRGLDAPQLTRRIRADSTKRYQCVRIIVLRLAATVPDVQSVRDSGADEFLAMPLTQGSMLAALHRVTSTPQHFVDCEVYKGPCRRRRQKDWDNERRRIEANQSGADTGTALIK